MHTFKVIIPTFVLLFSGISWAHAGAKAPTVQITEVNTEKGIITGTLENLTKKELSNYSVALYLQTDTFYLHPFVHSLAKISPDGRWKSRYIKRGDSKRVAAVLIAKGSHLPLSIRNPNSIEASALTVVPMSTYQ